MVLRAQIESEACDLKDGFRWATGLNWIEELKLLAKISD
jgi:hypothetical protein